jgi:S-formylglutathione hydrolase
MSTTDIAPAHIELAQLTTDLVPAPVDYAVLTPAAPEGPLPLVLLLHGGGGNRDFLTQARPWFERAWAKGAMPRCVVVTPSVTPRSFYMNFHDGSERWEDVVTGPLLEAARERHGATTDRALTAVSGPSMGGMGSLRIAFKHPHLFVAVAGLEPGIEPAFRFADIALEDRFWRDTSLFEKAYGSPIEEAYWQVNNPANIARDDPQRLIDSGLAIYLECGDHDSFGLHRGTEFLHRVLFDHGISHEYRLVRGADHVGATLPGRFADAFAFIRRAFDPPPPDPGLERLHTMIDRLRDRAGLAPRPGRAEG